MPLKNQCIGPDDWVIFTDCIKKGFYCWSWPHSSHIHLNTLESGTNYVLIFRSGHHALVNSISNDCLTTYLTFVPAFVPVAFNYISSFLIIVKLCITFIYEINSKRISNPIHLQRNRDSQPPSRGLCVCVWGPQKREYDLIGWLLGTQGHGPSPRLWNGRTCSCCFCLWSNHRPGTHRD